MTEDVTIVAQHLAAHPFAKGLEPHDIEILQELGQPAEFEANDVIFRMGDTADRFYLIRSGVVALQVDAGSALPRTVQRLAEGSVLGWSWLFPPHQWEFDAVAETPVRAIAIDAAGLRSKMDANPERGYRILLRIAEVMADRLNATRKGIASS